MTDLFWQFEVEQAALPQCGLQDLDKLHRLAGREPGHQFQQLLHESVLEVG